MGPIRVLDAEAVRAAEQARVAKRRARNEEARRAKARPPEMRNISRLEAGTTRGWSVRFQRDGEKQARFFKDADHGGPDQALVAAQAWRDETREALGPVTTWDAGRMHTPQARDKNRQSVSQTGVTGISVVARPFGQRRVPYVTAYWIDEDGKRRQTSFSAQRHGIEGALRLAARVRADTADWHGAAPMTIDEIFDGALSAVRDRAEPLL